VADDYECKDQDDDSGADRELSPEQIIRTMLDNGVYRNQNHDGEKVAQPSASVYSAHPDRFLSGRHGP
jgi:hypothetical protein